MPIIRRPLVRAAVVGGAVHHANRRGYEQAQNEQAMQQQAYVAGQASAQQHHAQPQQVYASPPPPQQQYAHPAPATKPAAAAAPPARKLDAAMFSTVFVSATSRERAEAMASRVVAQRLAGTVSVMPGVQSYCCFEGEVQHEEDMVLICRTRTALVHELTEFVMRNVEEGEVPEVSALPVVGGNPDYQVFLLESTKEP